LGESRRFESDPFPTLAFECALSGLANVGAGTPAPVFEEMPT
jgi:hypothetical protein